MRWFDWVEGWPRPDRNHGGADMAQIRTAVGRDVHVAGTRAAVLDLDSGELHRPRLSGRTDEMAAFVADLPASCAWLAAPAASSNWRYGCFCAGWRADAGEEVHQPRPVLIRLRLRGPPGRERVGPAGLAARQRVRSLHAHGGLLDD
jgi:hypothetical protein